MVNHISDERKREPIAYEKQSYWPSGKERWAFDGNVWRARYGDDTDVMILFGTVLYLKLKVL